MKLLVITMILGLVFTVNTKPDPFTILKKVDQNMNSSTKIIKARMVIYGKRKTREMSFVSYSKGKEASFTEYLSPAKQKGTKMLKLKNNLWIYSPAADRTIQLSGHMLKQSLMGSDISYEDMMAENTLAESYNATLETSDTIDGHLCWVISLVAKVEDVNYHQMKIWVDKKRNVTLKEDLFAKSGQLLKQVIFTDIKTYGKRNYATRMNFKDALKKGKGTDFIIDNIQFDVPIDPFIFTKAALKK